MTTKETVIVTDEALSLAASELHHPRKLRCKAKDRIAVVGDEVKAAVRKYRAEHGDVKVQVEGHGIKPDRHPPQHVEGRAVA